MTKDKTIYPIVAYGDPVLRRKAEDIDRDFPDLDKLVADMFETMYRSVGVGLAAPQIGMSIRLFVIDASPYDDEDESLTEFKKVFINAVILEENGDPWKFNEGCLSIPHLREDVSRNESILIEYFDEHWVKRRETYSGLAARIIQHEYDHIEGILFTDRISPMRRRLIQKKLEDISKGKVNTEYRMRFPSKK
jgi:peptide deformylase